MVHRFILVSAGGWEAGGWKDATPSNILHTTCFALWETQSHERMHCWWETARHARMRAGKRMVLGDWAQCPACACPANMAAFLRLLGAQRQCPLCCAPVEPGQVRRVADPLAALLEGPADVAAVPAGGGAEGPADVAVVTAGGAAGAPG